MPPRKESNMTPDELRKALAALGWNQPEAARQSGLSLKSINGYINGRAAIPPIASAFFRCALKGGK